MEEEAGTFRGSGEVGGERSKVAIITGATRGLGLAMTEELSVVGFHVIFTGRDGNKGRKEERRLRQIGLDVRFFLLDVSDLNSIIYFAYAVEEQYGGRINVIVNNAAVCSEGWNGKIVAESVAVNVEAVANMIEVLVSYLVKGGAVVNISSGDGETKWLSTNWRETMDRIADTDSLFAAMENLVVQVKEGSSSEEFVHGEQPAYKLSKNALNKYTQLIKETMDNAGVDIFCVCPGDVRTRMNPGAEKDPRDAALEILWLIDNETRPSSGYFYRGKHSIPW